MKSKYHFALKFFNETKKFDQLDLLYKEVEAFLDNMSEFIFFIKLDLTDFNPKSNVSNENQVENPNLIQNNVKQNFGIPDEYIPLLDNPDFVLIFNDYRLRRSEDIFSNYQYNFELFKYALEKVFGEERQKKEEEAKLNSSMVTTKEGSNYMIWISAFFFIGILIVFGLNSNQFINLG